MWAWVCAAILLLLGVLAVTPVRIFVHYGRGGENDSVVVELSAWFRLFRRKFEIPFLSLEASVEGPKVVARTETVKQGNLAKEEIQDVTRRKVKKWYDKFHELLLQVHNLRSLVRHFCKKVRCTRLEWHTVMGTGHADETGALSGIVWGIKSMIIGVLSHSVSLRTMPRLSVQPVWNETILRTQLEIQFRFYLGHAIAAGLKGVYRYWRNKIGVKWHAAPKEA